MCFTSDSYVYRLPISDVKRRCFAFRNTSQPTRTATAAWGDGWRGRGNDEEQQPRVVPWGDYRVSAYAWGAGATAC